METNKDKKLGRIEYACFNEKCHCFKMPGKMYDYCGINMEKDEVECNKRAMGPDNNGLYACFKYPRGFDLEQLDVGQLFQA